MIVRDVVLSSELRSLRPAVRIASDVPDNQRRQPRDPGPDASRPRRDSSTEPPGPPKPTLSVESAGAWLAMQSADMRAALARGLTHEMDSAREQGRSEGVELGRAQGLREVVERAGASFAALERVATAAEEAFSQESAQLAEACADIVSEAFLKIAGEHLASREAILGAVLQVLERVKDKRQVTIRVSSQDLPLLREYESDIQLALGSRQWSLVADPRVSLGGCLVESNLGALDGRLEIQLRELFETLQAAKTARWVGA